MRFTIRDILWLTVLAAVCAVWWIDRRQIAGLQHKSRELEAMRHVLREMGMEEWMALLTKMADPSQEQTLRKALAAVSPPGPPDQWTDEEVQGVIRFMNS